MVILGRPAQVFNNKSCQTDLFRQCSRALEGVCDLAKVAKHLFEYICVAAMRRRFTGDEIKHLAIFEAVIADPFNAI